MIEDFQRHSTIYPSNILDVDNGVDFTFDGLGLKGNRKYNMITKINDDLKQAMRMKDTTRLNVLRALKNAITNASLAKGNIDEPVNELEILGIVRKAVSTREDAMKLYVSSMRDDLIKVEKDEIAILNEYLPKPLTEAEIENIIQRAINDVGATTKKDMGKAIKRALELSNGCVDNKTISQRIGQLL
jgi:uncharacterized protein YqeY